MHTAYDLQALQICFRVIRDSCQESGVLSIAMKKVTKKKEIWAEKLQKSVFIKKKELNYIYYN
jgi:hypothetical protein